MLIRKNKVKVLSLTLLLIFSSMIQFALKPTAEATGKIPLGGGSGIVLKFDNNPLAIGLCTLGAIGKDNKGNLIGITAGHCGTPGEKFQAENYRNQGDIGEFIYSNDDLDFAIVKLDQTKIQPVKKVGRDGVSINRIDRKPINFPETVCKTGRTTGTNCGIVYESDKYTHTTSLCVLEGDSGGPVTKGDALVGIVTAYYGSSLPIGCFPSPETGTTIDIILKIWNKGFNIIN